ncbi:MULTISPECIES: EAL domain-containing protein [unclassified Pseudoalteromonas]|uniref:EAL domain-containing protein n=1 Tax=unclassified Pseudoalteromonas TaxID=194690 RepID=UPI003864D439
MLIVDSGRSKNLIFPEECFQYDIASYHFHFQPIYCLKTGKIKLYEALLRNSESTTNIEKTVMALISQGKEDLLTLHTLSAVKPFFSDNVKSPFSFSLNFEPAQIASSRFPALVKYFFNRFNIPKQNVMLEITERACSTKMYQSMIKNIEKLITEGFAFAMDDFGTGMSNFELLSQLNIKLIKIDGCFINSAFDNSYSKSIIEMAATFKEKFNCSVCIEGLETQEHIDFVKKLNFCFGQGYALARPAPLSPIFA